MHKKVMVLLAISLLVFLSACESKTVGKRVAVPETSSKDSIASVSTQAEVETGKTAAEALKDLKSGSPTGAIVTDTSPKSGTYYPPVVVPSNATGEDALKYKTDALMRQSGYDPNVEADTEFGPRYFGKDLPGNYTNH